MKSCTGIAGGFRKQSRCKINIETYRNLAKEQVLAQMFLDLRCREETIPLSIAGAACG